MSTETLNYTYSACELHRCMPSGPGGMQVCYTQSFLDSQGIKYPDTAAIPTMVCANEMQGDKVVGRFCLPGTDVAHCKKELHQ